jgi:hypothetical protein
VRSCSAHNEAMDNFDSIGQRAQKALEALCEDAPLESLIAAKRQFDVIRESLKTAPEDVRKCVSEFIDLDIEHNIPKARSRLQSAIESVFEESGREQMTLSGTKGNAVRREPWSN